MIKHYEVTVWWEESSNENGAAIAALEDVADSQKAEWFEDHIDYLEIGANTQEEVNALVWKAMQYRGVWKVDINPTWED